MEITTSSNTVTINGNIKSINDFQDIKNTIDSVKSSNTSITLVLEDSISITSSVIGYLNKIVLKDKITLNTRVGNPQLMELLSDLSLIDIFNAKRA